jgi:membrane-associated phospholipid phosphatase
MNKFAKILSYIFDGTLISIPMLVIICLATVDNTTKALGWAFLCLIFAMLIPSLYIHMLFRNKLINDLHIPDKEDRIKPLIIAIISNITGFSILYILKAPLFLKAMSLITIILIVILGIITYFWKVSMHAAWITFMVVTFNVLFGKLMLFLLPLIPVVGWARVRIKRHTVNQVVSGSIISLVTSFIVYYGYGFINF